MATDDAANEVFRVPFPTFLPDGTRPRFARLRVTAVP
jgi:hypothetical protein